ncbi:MAG TPA: hypothetical protein VEK15_18505 [Vicinamibacteria bacterium]|nr:hypothetical protein [Vicinamibacteria bacterium]
MVETSNGAPTTAAPLSDLLSRLSHHAALALRYWEPRRLLYNGVLGAVVVTHFVLAWPASREQLSFDIVLGIFLLAVLANVAYCAAYLPDLFVRFSGLDAAWRWGRTILLAVGTSFAAAMTHFFAKGIFGV